MNDNQTLSTMAISPMSFDVTSWEILTVSEEVVHRLPLADMNTKELELKKSVEDSVGITLDARADLDEAIFEKNNARTGAAREPPRPRSMRCRQPMMSKRAAQSIAERVQPR